MTREEYIKYRNNNNIEPVYEIYKERFDKEKHKKFLNLQEFFEYFIMWPPSQQVYSEILQYYDAQFNVMKINTGKMIFYE